MGRRATLRDVFAIVSFLFAWTSPAHGAEIHDAAMAGDVARVEALLQANPALVHSADSQGLTPLLYATDRGHSAVVQLLLGHGANANARTPSAVTSLHIAADRGRLDIAQELLSHQAEVDPRNDKG